MLSDEQLAVLPPKAQGYLDDLRQRLTSFSAVLNLAQMLATTLLARQRLERRLEEARATATKLYQWFQFGPKPQKARVREELGKLTAALREEE